MPEPDQNESVLEPDVDPTAQAAPVSPGAPTPNLERTEAAMEQPRAGSFGVVVLAVLASFYTLYFARSFLLPIVFALLLTFLFSPVIRAFARFRIRPPVSAAIVILAMLGIVGLSIYELSGPVQSWAADAPNTLKTVQTRMKSLLRPLERASSTAKQVESATSGVGDAAAPAREVVVRKPGLTARIFGTTQRLLTATLEVVILLYFLLAAGDLFLQKLIKVLPNLGDKRKAVEIAREIESSISTYLLTTASITVGEGIVVAGAMYLLGMPNPVLWGALVAVLEFVPYLGAITMIVVLSIAAIVSFDSLAHALLVPGVFLLINLVQGNFVSPLFLGHRLSLNPVALLVGLTFWWWIWGIPGAFVAVPLMAMFKIVCDHIGSLAAIGEFLGERDEGERRATIR